jgi:glycosyltransferase involved in cell wall biosynthesis
VIGRAAGIPIIVSTQHLPADVYSFRTQLFDQLTFPLADSVVCVSKAVQKSFSIAARLMPRQMSVIYNGVDISKIDRAINNINVSQKREQLGFALGDPLIGNVARLSPQKNQKCLIDAMNIIVTEKPNARLLIVGWGPLEEQLQSQIEHLGLQDNVFLLGRRPVNEVFEILSSIDVFALSSVYEGFSLTILEAMAAGRPIVSTDVAGVQEAIVDGETGVLVPPRNAPALARAILGLLEDERRLRTMGSAGRKRVEQRFSSESMSCNYLRLYEGLLEQKGLGTDKAKIWAEEL